MTPEEHIDAGDLLLRWAQVDRGPLAPSGVGDETLRAGVRATAHYAAATAKLALLTYEKKVAPFDWPVAMTFTAKQSADGKALEIDHSIPPHVSDTRPTA